MVENLILGKLGLKLVFWKSISSHTHVFFISYIQYFEVCFQKSGYFSKKIFFQIFDWSNLFFDQLKSCLKICVSLCLVRLIDPVFSINRTSWIWFFKHGSWLFQKFFSSFLSLSDSDLAPPQFFVVFDPFFCKVSLSKHW